MKRKGERRTKEIQRLGSVSLSHFFVDGRNVLIEFMSVCMKGNSHVLYSLCARFIRYPILLHIQSICGRRCFVGELGAHTHTYILAYQRFGYNVRITRIVTK